MKIDEIEEFYYFSKVSENLKRFIIIQLSYTPGTFDEPTVAREGETIGTINFVDESLNELTAELAADDVEQRYATSASVAEITSTVKFAEPSVGGIGNLEFKVLTSDS